jgi:predicted ATP-grasp superfamily ATP-dependent carboligase
MTPAVGVVGASARAAVHSLARAGYSAWAVDLFADRDLARIAPCVACPMADYPAALPRLAAAFPPGPVLYTGGLENHPAVVAELSARRELWGNPPDVLEAVRNPHRLFAALDAAGFAVPSLVPPGSPCPTSGSWLRKPLRSSAGHGIRFAKPGEPASPAHYFQEFIEGVGMSAVYGGTTLLGVTEQLVGEPWLHARPFHYCGSIGPVDIPPDVFRHRVSALAELGLRGLWNTDFVLRDRQAVPVEVNPRYSASVEVLEHARGAPAFGVWLPSGRSSVAGVVGKAIYFAPRDLTFPATGPWDADLAGEFDPWRLPGFADIPAPGSFIDAGQPVLTFFATGKTPAEVRDRLQSRATELDRLFAESTA